MNRTSSGSSEFQYTPSTASHPSRPCRLSLSKASVTLCLLTRQKSPGAVPYLRSITKEAVSAWI